MSYKNGVRYGFMYTARQQASFDEHADAFEKLVATLELTTPKAPAAVK
jgi:hypothetical protein